MGWCSCGAFLPNGVKAQGFVAAQGEVEVLQGLSGRAFAQVVDHAHHGHFVGPLGVHAEAAHDRAVVVHHGLHAGHLFGDVHQRVARVLGLGSFQQFCFAGFVLQLGLHGESDAAEERGHVWAEAHGRAQVSTHLALVRVVHQLVRRHAIGERFGIVPRRRRSARTRIPRDAKAGGFGQVVDQRTQGQLPGGRVAARVADACAALDVRAEMFGEAVGPVVGEAVVAAHIQDDGVGALKRGTPRGGVTVGQAQHQRVHLAGGGFFGGEVFEHQPVGRGGHVLLHQIPGLAAGTGKHALELGMLPEQRQHLGPHVPARPPTNPIDLDMGGLRFVEGGFLPGRFGDAGVDFLVVFEAVPEHQPLAVAVHAVGPREVPLVHRVRGLRTPEHLGVLLAQAVPHRRPQTNALGFGSQRKFVEVVDTDRGGPHDGNGGVVAAQVHIGVAEPIKEPVLQRLAKAAFKKRGGFGLVELIAAFQVDDGRAHADQRAAALVGEQLPRDFGGGGDRHRRIHIKLGQQVADLDEFAGHAAVDGAVRATSRRGLVRSSPRE